MQKQSSAPAIAIRAGRVEKPDILPGDVLNFIGSAGLRHVLIVMNACGDRCSQYPAKRLRVVGNQKNGRAAV